ncbi:MAG: HAMP domain-containing protein [Anaerolineales bacterium]|nr:HAMP domain-containing protein [Anaerolineales bacterium]
MSLSSPRSPLELSSPVRLALGAAATLALALGVFTLLMQPGLGELGQMAALLAVTTLLSVVAAYAAYRLKWIQRSPRLRWTIWAGAMLSSLLTFLNVWLAAQQMFASPHDLALAGILLLFASGLAVTFGYFFAEALTDRLTALDAAARAIAGGQLTARAPERGRDELAELARSFNHMAAQLEAADRKQRELEQLRRDLIAWVSHDLQTPLAAIRARVEALADGVVDEPASAQRYLQTVRRDVQALSALIDDLFQMAQLEAGGLPLERAPGSLADLISDTLESFAALAAEHLVTLSGQAEGVDPFTMDTARIGRVLANLVGNAVRHTPAGGAVTVQATRTGTMVRVEVADTGEGIAAADLPRIFEQFYRGEKSRNRTTGGAGLGLAIARAIVEAHGGHIGADSAPGRGTRVFFTLPGG